MTVEVHSHRREAACAAWCNARDVPPAEAAAVTARMVDRRRLAPSQKPSTDLVTEWLIVPPTSLANYITAGSALNIPHPSGRGGGDWHNQWRYSRSPDERRPVAHMAAAHHANKGERFHAVLGDVVGDERIGDVRKGLAALGHPAGHDAEPVWAALHERATLEHVLGSILRPLSPRPGKPEWILDRRTVHRWIPWADEIEWVERKLEAVAELVGGERAEIAREWAWNAFHNPAPAA